MSIVQYARFLIVGAVVALITIGSRELIGLLLRADTPLYYSISVIAAYAIGIALSFQLNSKFTFGSQEAGGWSKFAMFILVALTGMLVTWLLSLALRYGLGLDSIIGQYSAAVSFATAALLASAVTYPLNALLIFRRRRSTATESTRTQPVS